MNETERQYDHIIVAVHGIGDQMRNATVRDVATRYARLPDLAKGGVFVAPQPLGYFHTDVTDAVKVSPLGNRIATQCPLMRIGFSEVYWADIPDIAVRDGHTLEETKAWARTVVSRVRAEYYRTRRGFSETDWLRLPAADRLQLREPDFTLAAEVLEEIIDTIDVLENLLFLAKKAGIAEFDLRRVLEQYVGDVQTFTEFRQFRCDIIGRFHRAMQQIHEDHDEARLHIVAHSEGTVVSFLGLLHALSGHTVTPALDSKDATISKGTAPPGWVRNVAGLMTFGSPIDKHLLLWPELFEQFDFAGSHTTVGASPIEWRNYYDYGDPVGFKLDTARRWLDEVQCKSFNFKQEELKARTPTHQPQRHDIGFARYLLPGKAHNDYWTDAAVFEHYVRDVIFPEGPAAVVPRTRPLVYLVSPLIPYLLSFVLLYTGTLILHRAVSHFIRPPLETIQSYVLWTNLGSLRDSVKPGLLYQEALGLAFLYAGTTLLARWPRLARGGFWPLAGILAFGVGCIGYLTLLPRDSRESIGSLFHGLGGNVSYWTLLAALIVALVGLTGVSKPDVASIDTDTCEPDKRKDFGRVAKDYTATLLNRRTPRRHRWFSKRMRPLVVCGVSLIASLVVFQMRNPPPALTPAERAQIVEKYVKRRTSEFRRAHASAAPEAALRQEAQDRADQFSALVQVRAPVWPVVMAGAAFLYLWWLAALIFDLGFVWQRYVRRSVTLDRIAYWKNARTRRDPSTTDVVDTN